VTGAQGLVVQDLAGLYGVGDRSSSWWKYKRRGHLEAIVGGVTGAIEDPLRRGPLRQQGQLRELTAEVRMYDSCS
jgi:hypothetical protein